jgi:hypothetical protein
MPKRCVQGAGTGGNSCGISSPAEVVEELIKMGIAIQLAELTAEAIKLYLEIHAAYIRSGNFKEEC